MTLTAVASAAARSHTGKRPARRQHGQPERAGTPAPALVSRGQADLPLRHVRRPVVLGRHPAPQPGDRWRGAWRRRPWSQPEASARAGTEGRRGRVASVAAARPSSHGTVNLERPGGDAGAAEAQRRGRRQGLLQQQRQPELGRHRVRAVPLDRGQLPGPRHRPPPRWLGQPRPERRRHHRASRRTCSQSRRCWASAWRRCRRFSARWGPGKFDAELLLDGKAIPAQWNLGRGADSAGLRPGRHQPAHLHRLGLDPVLERVRRGTWRCTATARSSTRGSTTPSSSPSPRRTASATSRQSLIWSRPS